MNELTTIQQKKFDKIEADLLKYSKMLEENKDDKIKVKMYLNVIIQLYDDRNKIVPLDNGMKIKLAFIKQYYKMLR